jgi:hypothetical protein
MKVIVSHRDVKRDVKGDRAILGAQAKLHGRSMVR